MTAPVAFPRSNRPHLSRALLGATKLLASAFDPERAMARLDVADRSLPVRLATFTGARDVPACVAMICTFLQHVGRPFEVVIGSDGTLGTHDRALLDRLPVVVTVTEPDATTSPVASESLTRHATLLPLGRKLVFLIDLATRGDIPTLYADTDVLFRSASGHLVALLDQPVEVPRYMADPEGGGLDRRVDPGDGCAAVNSGFLILPTRLSFDRAISRCAPLIGDPHWFTEQTVVHHAVHQAGGDALPADRYLLDCSDRRLVTDRASAPEVVARHYVTPVRHKYWIAVHGGTAATAVAIGGNVVRRLRSSLGASLTPRRSRPASRRPDGRTPPGSSSGPA